MPRDQVLSSSITNHLRLLSLISTLFRAAHTPLDVLHQGAGLAQERVRSRRLRGFHCALLLFLLLMVWMLESKAQAPVQVQVQAQPTIPKPIQNSIQVQTQDQNLVAKDLGASSFKETAPLHFSKGPWTYSCDDRELTGARPNEESFKRASSVDQEALLKALRSAEPSCLKSAPYYALLGNLHLLAHQPKEALEALERSLLIEPNQPGVQFDFALSLAEAGDVESAKALIDQIMLRPDVPLALRQSIAGLKDRQKKDIAVAGNLNALSSSQDATPGSPSLDQTLNPKTASKTWTLSGNIGLMLGRDSNLNSASFVNTVNLTLPNGVVALTLDPSSLPQSGPVHLATTQLIAQRPWGDKTLVLSASWMGRETPGNPGLGFNNEEFVAHWRPQGDLGWHQRAVVNHFELGSSNFYNGLTWSNWWQSDVSTRLKPYLGENVSCFSKVGADLERRTYAQDPSQNGVYLGALLGGSCLSRQDQFNLTVQDGQDWASDALRAGGNQRRLEVKFQWFHVQEKARFGFEAGQQWLRDSTTYSELLGGIDRITQRNSVRMSYQYQLIDKLSMMEGSLAWVTTLERQSYRSTISLFNLRGESLQTGLKWEF